MKPPSALPVDRGRWDDFSDEFHRQLGRLVRALANFDFSMGLQLSWMGPHCAKEVLDQLDPKQVNLDKRLRALKKLIKTIYAPAGPAALAEFDDWFRRANEAKAMRNRYVHGRWGVPGKLLHHGEGRFVDAIPLLVFLPLTWDMSPDQPDKSVTMTIEEFSEQVMAVEALVIEYRDLCAKYEELTIPRVDPARK